MVVDCLLAHRWVWSVRSLVEDLEQMRGEVKGAACWWLWSRDSCEARQRWPASSIEMGEFLWVKSQAEERHLLCVCVCVGEVSPHWQWALATLICFQPCRVKWNPSSAKCWGGVGAVEGSITTPMGVKSLVMLTMAWLRELGQSKACGSLPVISDEQSMEEHMTN